MDSLDRLPTSDLGWAAYWLRASELPGCDEGRCLLHARDALCRWLEEYGDLPPTDEEWRLCKALGVPRG